MLDTLLEAHHTSVKDMLLLVKDARERQSRFLKLAEKLRAEVSRSVIGLYDPDSIWYRAYNLLLMGLLAGEHVAMVGLPGTGKTYLIESFCHACGIPFASFAGDAETSPSDLLGIAVEVIEDGERKQKFRKGRVFSPLLFVDEVNGLNPHALTALRPILWGKKYTDIVTGEKVAVPDPGVQFWAYNPAIRGATFEIPLAVRDRFLLSTWFGRAADKHVDEILEHLDTLVKPEDLTPQLCLQDFIEAKADLEVLYPSLESKVAWLVARRIMSASRTKRGDDRSYLVSIEEDGGKVSQRRISYRDLLHEESGGLSERASVLMFRAARLRAYLRGAQTVTEDDVIKVAPDVCRQRLQFTSEGWPFIGYEGIERFVLHLIDTTRAV
jgi:MoxR-like ATPase